MMPRQETLVSENVGGHVPVEAHKATAFLLDPANQFRTLTLKVQSFALQAGKPPGLAATRFTPEAVK